MSHVLVVIKSLGFIVVLNHSNFHWMDKISKYLIWCSTDKSHRFGMTWWVNDDRIFRFHWAIPWVYRVMYAALNTLFILKQVLSHIQVNLQLIWSFCGSSWGNKPHSRLCLILTARMDAEYGQNDPTGLQATLVLMPTVWHGPSENPRQLRPIVCPVTVPTYCQKRERESESSRSSNEHRHPLRTYLYGLIAYVHGLLCFSLV